MSEQKQHPVERFYQAVTDSGATVITNMMPHYNKYKYRYKRQDAEYPTAIYGKGLNRVGVGFNATLLDTGDLRVTVYGTSGSSSPDTAVKIFKDAAIRFLAEYRKELRPSS